MTRTTLDAREAMDKELRDEYLRRLSECAESDDTESAHADADQVLCDLLSTLGFDDIVEAYSRVSKWYA